MWNFFTFGELCSHHKAIRALRGCENKNIDYAFMEEGGEPEGMKRVQFHLMIELNFLIHRKKRKRRAVKGD